MSKIKNYYQTTRFAELANVSTKSLSRLKKLLLHNNPASTEVIKKWNRNYYHYTVLKKFVSKEVYQFYTKDVICNNEGDTFNEHNVEA